MPLVALLTILTRYHAAILTRYGLSKVSTASPVCNVKFSEFQMCHREVWCGGGVSKLWTYGRVTAPYGTPMHTAHCTLHTAHFFTVHGTQYTGHCTIYTRLLLTIHYALHAVHYLKI